MAIAKLTLAASIVISIGMAPDGSKADLTPESFPKLHALIRPQDHEWRHEGAGENDDEQRDDEPRLDPDRLERRDAPRDRADERELALAVRGLERERELAGGSGSAIQRADGSRTCAARSSP